MSAIDHSFTRVLLIGASEFPRDETIHPIPNVAANLQLFRECLLNPALIGVPASNITVSLNESRSIIERRLRQIAAETRHKDYTLVVYYAGHGILSSIEYKLFLTTADTSHEDLEIDGISIDVFRSYIKRSNAGRKVILLDCCHSGAVIETMSNLTSRIQAGLRGFEGTYVMTSAAPDEPSMFPVTAPDQPTYFTGKLIDIIQSGLPAAGEYCSLRDIFNEIEYDFTNRFPPLPRPQQSSFLHADQLYFCKNKLYDTATPVDVIVRTPVLPPPSPPRKKRRYWIIMLISVMVSIGIYSIINLNTLQSVFLNLDEDTIGITNRQLYPNTSPSVPDTNATALSKRGANSKPASEEPDKSYIDYYNKGADYYNAKKYQQAIRSFTQAINLNKEDRDSYAMRGISKYYLNLYEAAIEDLTKAINLNVEGASAYQIRAQAEQASGLYGDAIADYTKAISRDNKDFFTIASRGRCKYHLSLYDDAIADYNKSLLLTTQYAWVYGDLANAYYMKGDYETSLTNFNKAINLDPKDPIYWNGQGDAQRKSGQDGYCKAYEAAARLGSQEGSRNVEKYCNK